MRVIGQIMSKMGIRGAGTGLDFELLITVVMVEKFILSRPTRNTNAKFAYEVLVGSMKRDPCLNNE